MTVIAQGQGQVSIDNGAGTLTAINAGATGFSLSVEQTVGTYTTLSNNWAQALYGGRSWTAEVEVVMENGSPNGYQLLSDWILSASPNARTLQVDQPDSLTGSVRYTGECRIASLPAANAAGGSGDAHRVRARLTGDGVLTKSIVV